MFYYPEDPSTSFVKRVILADEVFINGDKLDEPYLEERFRVLENRDPIDVRRGFYYVLGDHRGESFDSRFWGLVPERYIYGKVIFSYWPPEHLKIVTEH